MNKLPAPMPSPSATLLAAADLLREIEQAKAVQYKHITQRYTREEMQKYFHDRDALIRVQGILVDLAEIQGG